MEETKNENEEQINPEKDKEKSNYNFLLEELSKYGYSEDNLISQSELNLFFQRKSKKNELDLDFSEKLFNFLNLNKLSVITISQFISGFLQIYKEFIKKREELNKEYSEEKQIYDNLINMCTKYQDEKLNEEGFSENAKLSGEIVDLNFNLDLKEMQEIIVQIIYGEQKHEITQNVEKEQENENNNKSFEFKASSKKENLKFVLMSKNNLNNTQEIGSKTYSLEELDNQDPFLVKVEIPFEEDEEETKDQFAAVLQAKLQLKWSDLKYYEQEKEKEEQQIKKLETDIEEVDETIKKLEFILSEENNENVGKEKQKEEVKGIEKGLRKKIIEFPEEEYIVEFNYERIDNIMVQDLKIDYNNEKELNEKKELDQNNEEIELNNENENINNNINLEYDYNYNDIENSNNLYETNYNIENNNENKEENLVQEEYDYSHDIIIDESLNNQQNEQINFDNQININPQQNFTSYTDALLTQSTNKAIIQESTLPLKYLPQKVNKVIFDNNVSTLPLIDAGKKVTYYSMP